MCLNENEKMLKANLLSIGIGVFFTKRDLFQRLFLDNKT